MKVAVKLARTTEDKNASLNRIEQDIDRLTSILSDVVEIAAVEGDPASKETELVDLQRIVEDVVRDCDLEAEQRGCSLSLDGTLTGWSARSFVPVRLLV